MSPKTTTTLSTCVVALASLLAACSAKQPGPASGDEVASNVGPQPPINSPSDGEAKAAAGPQKIVETHERGVFFDARPMQSQVRELAGKTRPAIDRLQTANVVDSTGFDRPMTAMTVAVPAGWTTRGGVQWTRSVECAGNTHAFNWTATSPDGLHEFSLLPKFTWQVSSAPGGIVALNPCPAAPMRTAREYLEFLAMNSRPGAQVLDYRARPDLAEQMRASIAAGGGGNNSNVRYDAGELLIGYSLQGHAMRESIVSLITTSELQGTMVAWAETGVGLRAPDGFLDLDVLEKIRQTLRIERPWGEQMIAWTRQHIAAVNQRQVTMIQEWHNRRMSEINMAGMTARHKIRMETIADIGKINNQIVANTDATTSRGHEAFKDYIQEVQPWRDPSSGKQVDLSIHYSNAWQLSDGRQFLTNDASFDPNRDLGIEAQRLERVE